MCKTFGASHSQLMLNKKCSRFAYTRQALQKMHKLSYQSTYAKNSKKKKTLAENRIKSALHKVK